MDRTDSYKDLIVWQKSIRLVKLVYKATASFPSEEKYGLSAQMRRCAVSIPSNIAEGRRRGSRKDYCKFLRIANGSSAELETQIIIGKELDYLQDESYNEITDLLVEVMKMLHSMIYRLSD